jgi:FHA domain
MNLSRRHAQIAYNFDTARFELTLWGKHGLAVGAQLITPEAPPVPLSSGDLITGFESSFHFMLPRDHTALATRNGMAPNAPAQHPAFQVAPYSAHQPATQQAPEHIAAVQPAHGAPEGSGPADSMGTATALFLGGGGHAGGTVPVGAPGPALMPQVRPWLESVPELSHSWSCPSNWR